VFEIVVKRVASSQTFNGAPREGAKSFCHIIMGWAETGRKSWSEFAQLVGRQCRDRSTDIS
jgi:hypothetical protein